MTENSSLINETVRADVKLQAKDRYHRVPFDVPAGAQSVGVRIKFDSARGVVDLGCEGPSGWRGWSGGARTEYTIRADAATPGYLPGPLEAGEWAVILGIHNLLAQSVDIEVEISIPSRVDLPPHGLIPPVVANERGSARALPAPEGLTWYAGDFHNHTLHSDGKHSIEELAALGVSMGLDFLAVTDHNTTSHHPYLAEVGKCYGITLIPGQEVTTHRGHANAFGDIGWIDFREHPDRWVEEVEARGGVLSLNHPIDADCAWMVPLKKNPGAVELWHSSWYRDLYGTGIFAWLANRNRDVTLLGGNDFHFAGHENRPGVPTTWVPATDNSVGAIMEAIKAGRTTITGSARMEDGKWCPELMTCPILLRQDDNQMLVLGGSGTVLVDFDGKRTVIGQDQEIVTAPRSAGPYSLLLPDRKIVALCA